MKNIFQICLVSAALMIAGVLVVQAAGFVSYEPSLSDPTKAKIIVWDPLKMVNKGLKMSSLGINDLEDLPNGTIKIMDKDLYVRSFIGFECPDYPVGTCTTQIGDIAGDSFLKIETVRGNVLNLFSPKKGINFNADYVDISGQVILPIDGGINNPNNLILVDADSASTLEEINTETNSVFVNTLYTNYVLGNTLIMPNIRFNEGALFYPQRIININL
jgi:hypothetical protein